VGKSIGSLVLPAAAELAVPGIWLTPLISETEGNPATRRALATIADTRLPTLLVGGTADVTRDGAAARRAGTVYEVARADHALEIPGDWQASLAALAQVATAVDGFVAALEAAG